MLTTLTLALSLAAPAFQNPASEEAPSVVRIYDVRAAIPVAETASSGLVLLPLCGDYSNGYSMLDAERNLDVEAVTSFMRALDPAQWEYAERMLSMDSERWLTVLAPATLQDVVARSLVFLEETVARSTTLVVDIVTFGPNPGVSTLPSMMPGSEVSRWTALGTSHESYELSIRPGEPCRQRAERAADFALESDPIVAERSAGYESKPERITVGTAIECSVAPARTGTWLAFTLRNGRIVDHDGTHALNPVGAVTHDQGIEYFDGPKLRSDPRLANHSFSISAFLPDGKALVFVTTAGLESRVVFVRQTSPLLPTVVQLPDELKRVSNRNATTLVRTDAVNVPTAAVDRPGPMIDALELQQNSTNPSIVGLLGRSTRVEALEQLRTFNEDYEWIELGPFVALFGSQREAIDKAITRFSGLAPNPQLIAVTVALRRGSRDMVTLARATLPMRVGAESTLVLGRESLFDRAIGGEVAQGLVAMDTVVGRAFDGIVLTLEPHTTNGGALSLDIDAHGRWSRQVPREFDLGGKTSPRIQLPDADVLDVRRTQVLSKGETGARKFTLGNAGTSSEALSLEFEVVDLR